MELGTELGAPLGLRLGIDLVIELSMSLGLTKGIKVNSSLGLDEGSALDSKINSEPDLWLGIALLLDLCFLKGEYFNNGVVNPFSNTHNDIGSSLINNGIINTDSNIKEFLIVISDRK
ncbi:MAG: hypothetical protein ACI8RD_000594 [Bacillariaceae sp.]